MKIDAWRALRIFWDYPLRSFFSVIGILFAVACLIVLLAIGEGAKQKNIESIEKLGAHHLVVRSGGSLERASGSQGSGSAWLTAQEVRRIEKSVPELKSVAPVQIIEKPLSGSLADAAPELLATTRSFMEMQSLELLEGRLLCDMDVYSRQKVCILGQSVAEKLGAKGRVGSMLELGQESYRIVGLIRSGSSKKNKGSLMALRDFNRVVFVPLFSDRADEKISELVIEMDKKASINAAAWQIEAILKRQQKDLLAHQVVTPKELLSQLEEAKLTFDLAISAVAIVSLVLGAVGIMNVMWINVSERTQEIGIRRACGANRKDILFLFLGEAILLTLLGAFLGICLGESLSLAISAAADWPVALRVEPVLLSLVMASAVGLIAGLYPASLAAKVDPMKALRCD